ncbi:MAG: hypothetical protein KDA24_03585 [Deltaproteobacteria bacterium]|nr:hypothetical protein [Deltaproteobacteria bacterium]
MHRTFAAAARLGLVLAVALFAACPTGDDDDDSTPLIEPPEGCANFSLSGVTFDFFLRFGGMDYPMDSLEDLLEANGGGTLQLPIEGEVTKLEPDPDDDDKQILRVTELPPDDPPDDWEPNWIEIAAELPDGYVLPAALGEEMAVFFRMSLVQSGLISGFALLDSTDDGGGLRFLAEPSTLGFAFPPGGANPFFEAVDPVDRQCPNLTEFQCAKLYNLAIRFRLVPAEPDGPPGESFELWPTESYDFMAGGLEYRVVDVFSYTHREISDACTGFDWSADRMSYFVTRVDSAPSR